jgi:O-antigen/teichoic acid export membrane protein
LFEKEELLDPVDMPQKPWRQLAFVLGEAALNLVSGGILFIIVSRVSGPELLGTYALAIAWLLLFQGVSTFGIPGYLMREVGAYGRDAAGQVVHAMWLGTGSGFLGLCLMLAAVRLLGYSPDIVQVITVASLALIPASLNTACRSVFLALRLMQLTFLAVLVEVTIVMPVSLYLLLSGHGAIALMFTLVVAKVASASITQTLLFRRVFPVRPSFNLDFLILTARTVFTFGMGSMIGMLGRRINTIMVSVWVDIAAVGHFAAATKIMEIGLIVPDLLAQLLMTRIAFSFNTEGNRDPNRFGAWYQLMFVLVMPICVSGWVFSGLILQTLFGAAFVGAAWILRISMIYLVLEAADNMMSVTLQAAHRQRQDVSRLAFNPAVNIVLNLVLLPILGPIGAALGRVGGVATSAILRHLLIARVLTRMNWLSFALKPALISVGMGWICYLLLDVYPAPWVLVFYAAATGVLLRISSAFSPAAIKDMMSFPSRQE